ncbi:MAG: hypothetical protein IT258_21440, partial [Saprospiraceae bacterium]|nr:hypothetical protein [Saprospiraceae bacterium]
MPTGKLLQTLQVLTKAEWKELQLFLQSPYHNRGKEAGPTLTMFQFYLKHSPGFQSPKFNNEELYVATFPNASFVDNKLEKMKGRLYQLVMEFVSLHRKVHPNWVAMSAFYRERNLPKLAMQQHDIAAEQLNRNAVLDRNYYLLQLELQQELVAFHSSFDNKPSDLGLSDALMALDKFHLLSKLEYTCWLHMQGIHNELTHAIESLVPIQWLRNLLPSIGGTPFINEPPIACYYAAYQLLYSKDPNTTLLAEHLESTLDLHGDKLATDSFHSLQTILRTHVVGKYIMGYEHYLPIAFRLYKNHLDKGWLYYNGKLLPETILNIVSLGLRCNEAPWVYDFLQAHQDRIGGNYPAAEVYQYNLAHYHFHCRAYEAAGNLLNHDYQNFYYKVGARRLELMVLFEENSVLLTSKIEAFKMFIFRLSKKQVPDKLKQLNNN